MQIICLQMRNALRSHLKRTSKPSQEPQMVRIPFKKQSKLFEVAFQTLKSISRTSNGSNSSQTAIKTMWGRTSNEPQSNLKNFKWVKLHSKTIETIWGGFAPSMCTTSSHTSWMAIPSSTWSCHARAASVGCRPRGCTLTCTFGMASGWRCRDRMVCGLKNMRLQFGVNSDYDLC